MVIERIKEFLEWKEISIATAEKLADIKQSTLSKAIKNGTAIGTDKLENFLEAFPNLSAEWLLRGKGDMEEIGGEFDQYALMKDMQRTITRLLDRIDELEGKKNSVQNAG